MMGSAGAGQISNDGRPISVASSPICGEPVRGTEGTFTANQFAMKTAGKSKSKAGSAVTTVPVRFTLTKTPAGSVAIAGSFNGWKPEALPMVSTNPGEWHAEVALEPGVYQYLFVADGLWLPDPSVLEAVPNGYGGLNSVLRVKTPEAPVRQKKSNS
jgi:1,4-alpha-glucan branching enzyme